MHPYGWRRRHRRGRSDGDPVADRRAIRHRAVGAWRPPQRRGPLPLLARRGHQGGPGPRPVSGRGGDRELGARLQHRHGRAQRQRLRRPTGPHRGPPPLEPSRGDGHRPLPARRAPPLDRGSDPGGVIAGPCGRGDRQRGGIGPPGAHRAATAVAAAVRTGRTRALSCRERSASLVCSITMYGSTRSINAGVASGIVLHTWVLQHAPGPSQR